MSRIRSCTWLHQELSSHLSSTSRRRLCAIYECKAAKRHLSTLPYTVAERGGRISQITCWQDNRGEGGGEFSVLRESFMIESVCGIRGAPWLPIAGNAGAALSRSNVELCWIFFLHRGESTIRTSPRSSRWRGSAPIGADRSRLRTCPGDSPRSAAGAPAVHLTPVTMGVSPRTVSTALGLKPLFHYRPV